EIGRLREITFRRAGEGTGRSRDLDRFDRDYQHLFVWHRERRQIAGAYRVGATDRLCKTRGVKALYTHTLFKLNPELLQAGPMLELGRSFVRAEYQRGSNTLLLLWRGIGTVVARNPRYRRLFGPASISADYSMAARAAIASFFERASESTARPAQPRRPFAIDEWTRPLVHDAMTFEQLDDLVKELNAGVGVPVLVRQYWRLGATVLAAGVDPAFNSSLDALMVVDLAQVPRHLLLRYLGRDGVEAFNGQRPALASG
ncbi:MAG TPA: GNAT family N-acyltransferase, partial [Vicinamibacterales bacterium]